MYYFSRAKALIDMNLFMKMNIKHTGNNKCIQQKKKKKLVWFFFKHFYSIDQKWKWYLKKVYLQFLDISK